MSRKEQKKEPIVVAQIMGKWVGGGVEAVIMNYYRHIDRTKIQFDFICDEDSTNIPYEEIEKLGGKVILCPPYQKLHKYMKFLEKLFREKKYRIVHSNINTLSVFPLRAAKKAGVPVRIAHSHSISNPKEYRRNVAKKILRKFSKRYATAYFACGKEAGAFQFGNNKNIVIIPNAIDISQFKYKKTDRNSVRTELSIDSEAFVIGHIGRFVTVKNHEFLIKVFKEMCKLDDNIVLVLVGNGPLLENTKRQVIEFGLTEKVRFIGWTKDISRYYSAMDLFCLPSLYEGVPVVGIEAQAANLRCVISKNIPDDFIINKQRILALSLDDGYQKWSKKLLHLKEIKDDRQLYGASFKNSPYNIEIAAENLASLYKTLIGGQKCRQ